MTFLLFNPLNLLDGEVQWFLAVLALLAIAAGLSHFVQYAAGYLEEKSQKLHQDFLSSLFTSVQSPLVVVIWFFAFLQIANIIFDDLVWGRFPYYSKILVGVVVTLVSGWFLFRLKNNFTKKVIAKSSANASKVLSMSKLLSAVIVFFILFFLMQVTGLSITAFLAVGGIGGVAFAFAAQEIGANFFGGIMVSIMQSFRVGDYIVVPNTPIEGVVEDIGWYETRVRTKNRQPMYIPNSQFAKASVINNARRSSRKLEEKIVLKRVEGEKIASCINKIQEKILHLNDTLVFIDSITGATVTLAVHATVCAKTDKEYYQIRDTVLLEMHEQIANDGLELS